MIKIHHQKNAFSMIELVFVIVVLGIVLSIGSSIIADVYKSYILQRATHNASARSELAVNLISSRLVYRIDSSMLARKPTNTGTVEGTDVYYLDEVPFDESTDFGALEWINYDNDTFSTSNPPKWSGFADIDTSTATSIITTGSRATEIAAIRANLGANQSPGLIFLDITNYRGPGVGLAKSYNNYCMYKNNNCMFKVTPTSNTNLSLTGDIFVGEMQYSEFYQMTSTAYAVVPENDNNISGRNGNIAVFDLVLYYNYQPWEGENYTDGTRVILAEDVSVFRFKKETSSIRLKICTIEQIGTDSTLSICKEKAVIR